MKLAEALLTALREIGGEPFACRAMGAFHEYLRFEAERILREGHALAFNVDISGPKAHHQAEVLADLGADIVAAVENAS